MACPARARQTWRPAPKCHGAGNRCSCDADAYEGPMAGLVANIASAEATAGAAACLSCRTGSCGAVKCGGTSTAEVRGSNPLRSTSHFRVLTHFASSVEASRQPPQGIAVLPRRIRLRAVAPRSTPTARRVEDGRWPRAAGSSEGSDQPGTRSARTASGTDQRGRGRAEHAVRCGEGGAVQLRQHHRVSPIRLDPIAGFHRNQRGATTTHSWPRSSRTVVAEGQSC